MKNLNIILDITRTHMVSRSKQTIVAALGVTFGIGAFIILVGFMTGLNGLLDGLILNRTPHIHLYNEIKPSGRQPITLLRSEANEKHFIRSVRPKQGQTGIRNALQILNHLRKDQRVRGVAPQVAASVFYVAGSIELNGRVQGIEVREEDRLYNFNDYVVKGQSKLLDRSDNGILLGAGIAEKLSLSLGDRVRVSSASGAVLPLKIVGIFQSGLADIDNVQSYVNIHTAQQLLGEGRAYFSDLNVKLWDLNLASAMADELGQQYGLSATDINEANAQFDTGSSIRNLITYAVSITLLVVAGFGIYNILNMIIYEKNG